MIWVLQTAQLPLDGQQRKVTSPLQRSGGFEFLWRSSKVKERKKKGGGLRVVERHGRGRVVVCVCVPCPSLSASCTGRKRKKKSYDALRPLLPAAPLHHHHVRVHHHHHHRSGQKRSTGPSKTHKIVIRHSFATLLLSIS